MGTSPFISAHLASDRPAHVHGGTASRRTYAFLPKCCGIAWHRVECMLWVLHPGGCCTGQHRDGRTESALCSAAPEQPGRNVPRHKERVFPKSGSDIKSPVPVCWSIISSRPRTRPGRLVRASVAWGRPERFPLRRPRAQDKFRVAAARQCPPNASREKQPGSSAKVSRWQSREELTVWTSDVALLRG